VNKHAALVLAVAATIVSLAACSTTVTVPPVNPTSRQGQYVYGTDTPAAQSSAQPSYTVSCKVASGPYDSATSESSLISYITVTNTGSSPLTLPSPLAFNTAFFWPQGGQEGEFPDMVVTTAAVTIPAGGSRTFEPLADEIGGTPMNADVKFVDVNSCTASLDDQGSMPDPDEPGGPVVGP
jgi:hypothetical protein